MPGLHVLWFRHDLRVHDHAPLKAACLAAERDGGRVLPLYILADGAAIEPFLQTGLSELDAALEQRQASLHFRHGDPVSVLSDLHRDHNVLSLYSHEAPRASDGDAAVEAWCLRAGVARRIYPQFGPEPRPGDVGRAAQAFDTFMAAPRQAAPAEIPGAQVGIGQRPVSRPSDVTEALSGGRKAAIARLKALLGRVSDLHQIAADTPSARADDFDQLEAYLELGLLSVRETWQAAITARNQYHAAGQDIRAARAGELVRQLPSFHRARYARMWRTPEPPARDAGRSKAPKDGQLSFDLRSNTSV